VQKRSQANGIRIALPYHIHTSRAKVNWTAMEYVKGDINQHAVTKLYGVIEAQNNDWCSPVARSILEHALAPQSCLRVFSNRSGRRFFVSAGRIDFLKTVNVAG